MKNLMKAGNPTNTRAAQRIAVVSGLQGNILLLGRPWIRTLLPVLQSDLQRYFHRRRTAIGEEHVVQTGRSKVDQASSQANRGRMRHSQGSHVRDIVQLLPNRRVDLGATVTVHVTPETTDTIQVTPSLDVGQPTPISTLDDPRDIFGHLREAVPDDLAVPNPELFERGGHAITRSDHH